MRESKESSRRTRQILLRISPSLDKNLKILSDSYGITKAAWARMKLIRIVAKEIKDRKQKSTIA